MAEAADGTGPPVPDAAALAGLLADDDRRRVVAALVLGATTVDDVRQATGMAVRAAVTASGRLIDGGLVERGPDGGLVLLAAAFRRAAAAAAAGRDAGNATGVAGGAGRDPAATDDAKVLRAFLRGGRLTSIPTQQAKLLVVLDHVVQRFEPGVRYPEREVGARLRELHDDVAALRRHLVDHGFLDREAAAGEGGRPTQVEYWRTGGTYGPG